MRSRRPAPDDGSATVWVLLAATVVWSVGTWSVTLASVAAVRSRAASAADLAALAGAASFSTGEVTACGSAANVATANHASLRTCVVDPVARTVELVVELRGRGLLAHAPPGVARARAGPEGVER